MSIFKTKAIVLKIKKVSENDFLYTVFSYDYWKIYVNKKNKKQEKNLDLWYIINCEIKTNGKSNFHKIRNIKILSEFSYEKKNYSEINWYLELLSLVNNNIPDNLALFEIFNILDAINIFKKINLEKILLAKLKVLDKLWILKISHKNKTVEKILNFINKNDINKIIRLTWIDEKTKIWLESIINFSK